MKKLLLLGGSRYLLPIIKAAHEMGIYVITADYLPDNYAHKHSDEYCNVSIVDQEDTLKKAEELKIDGIMSFACDPGVVTAAYVAEKMGLPSVGSYEAVSILQNKGRFRSFLRENGFNVPKAKSFLSIIEALNHAERFTYPVIVKPTDSAGSKGVSKAVNITELEKCILYALKYSRSGEFIIEDYLQQEGFSSDTDSFSVNGVLKFVSFNSQRFDVKAENQFTPASYSWPSSISKKHQEDLKIEIQRLITLLDLKTSIYNIEVRECIDGKPYIMEFSPRGGGNRLAEVLRYATGVDLITNSVLAAMGEPCIDIDQRPYDGLWAEVILHSSIPGVFDELQISNSIKNSVVEEDLWIEKGEKVGGFSAANEAIGTIILRFDDEMKMNEFFSNMDECLRVIVK